MTQLRFRCARVLLSVCALVLAGCGTMPRIAPITTPASTVAHGEVYGGQQPVVGMSLQFYAVGNTGYGSTATGLFAAPITTNSNGGFSFAAYTCPTPNTQVYLVGVGGDPVAGNTGGNTNANPNLALMVALGACGGLNGSTHIHMNELTTVAAVWAFAPFMAGNTQSYLNIGASPTNALGLQLASEAAQEIANTSTGTFPGALPPGAVLPTSELNTIADILEACINSKGGTANDSTPCGNLFGQAPSATGYPTDTITAAMNIALNPARNISALYNIAAATAAFQPTLGTAPAAWTVAVQYTLGASAPNTIAADQSGNLWVTNNTGSSVTQFNNTGNPNLAFGTSGVLLSGLPAGIAIDLSGNAWIATGNNSLTEVSPSGTITTSLTGNGLNSPTGIAIDPSGNIWAVNSGSGANSVSVFSSSGTALTNSPFTGGGISAPAGIAINGNAKGN